MPPKAAAKTQRKGAVSGSICYQKIGPKDDVLFCSGACQKHLHRYCASVSELSFKALTSSDAPPFLCFCCYRTKKDEEIAKLQSIVELLQDEISSLKKASRTTVNPSLRSGTDQNKTAILPLKLISVQCLIVPTFLLPLNLVSPLLVHI